MRLNTMGPAPGSKRPKRRVGRGPGSGWGKTAARGQKGQKARSGGGVRPGFEGGQQPLKQRVPKFGFRSRVGLTTAEIRLKRVLWPVFARSGRLVVREFDRPLPEKYTLLFHSYCPPGKLIWPEAFEHALSLLAGLLFMGRDQHVPMEIRAPFTDWKPVEVRDPQRLAEPLEMLALAPHEPSGDLRAISRALSALPGRHPVFVVSEAPLRYWADQLPAVGRLVTCLDNSTLKVKRPDLRFRRAGSAA